MELAQERILTSMNQNSGSTIPPSEPRSLQLRFLNKLSLPVLAGKHIKGEDGTSVRVGLFDVKGEIVKYGLAASAMVEIVVLREDQNSDEGHDWTPEEFNLKIERERKGNRPLLIGNIYLNLKEGIGFVGDFYFSNMSDWMSKHLFRLGARIVDYVNGTRVREAKSEPFILADCSNKSYKKHYPPSLSDHVWRLKNINKCSPLVKRLSKENIKTVKDFLTQFFINRQWLRDILGAGMSDKKLEVTVEHGLTCKLDDRYLYPTPGSQQYTGVVFNAVGQVVGVLSQCHCVPINNLSETEKAIAQKLVACAFEHPDEVVSYDENTISCSSSHLPNAVSPRPESRSGPDVGTSPHMIAGYDNMQPSTASVGSVSSNSSVGNLHMIDGYDPMQPSTSSLGIGSSNRRLSSSCWSYSECTSSLGISSSNTNPSTSSIGTFYRIAAYDPSQPSTSSPGILPSNNPIGTSQMTVGYDHKQPGTSSPGIFSFGNSTGRASSKDGIGFLNDCGMEFLNEPSRAPGQVPNHQMFGPMSVVQDFETDEQFWFPSNNFYLQAMNLRAESPAGRQTAENDFLLLSDLAVAISNPLSRWFRTRIVLKFLHHVRKKQRVQIVPNHRTFVVQDFETDEQLWFPSNNCYLQAMNPRAESPADQQTAENGFQLVGAQAVAIRNPLSRWFRARIVLKFLHHVRRKQRVQIVPNHRMFVVQDFEMDEQLWFPSNNCYLQAMNPRAESPADRQTAANGFLLVGVQVVAIRNPLSRWFRTRIVLKFLHHVRKKQRVQIVPNHGMFVVQDFEMDKQLWFPSNNCQLQAMNPRAESAADGQTAKNGFLLVGAQVVAIRNPLSRWFRTRIVLKFLHHVRKKQRVQIVPNHRMFDPMSVVQDFEMDKQLWFPNNCNLKAMNPRAESPAGSTNC